MWRNESQCSDHTGTRKQLRDVTEKRVDSSGCAIPEHARANAWHKCLCPGCRPALAVKSGNNKIIYKDILTALADATNDLPMPCHEQPPLVDRSCTQCGKGLAASGEHQGGAT